MYSTAPSNLVDHSMGGGAAVAGTHNPNALIQSNHAIPNNNIQQLQRNDPMLAKRIVQIQARESNLLALEAELDEFEVQIKHDSKGIHTAKNWPFKNCAFARNDISLDIPVKYQSAVRKFYMLWWWTVMCTILNWLGIIWWASDNGSKFSDYLFATMFVVIGCPLSWLLLYKRFYRAMQAHGNISWLFFILLLLHMMWTALMALGFSSLSSAGWLLMTKEFVNNNTALGFMLLISATFWSINFLATLYLMKIAHYHLGRYLAKKYAHFND